ncbi:hypothetical protein PR048_000288 [Dryococelus australis]|uniref:Uncharacterized protein n=1 Tax=Dryococelus australis TaxID=614101 RepID=A0ABQ9IE84_9NEOP|nr:hypothetical protein PR048_000288 [Dryococelus australis]
MNAIHVQVTRQHRTSKDTEVKQRLHHEPQPYTEVKWGYWSTWCWSAVRQSAPGNLLRLAQPVKEWELPHKSYHRHAISQFLFCGTSLPNTQVQSDVIVCCGDHRLQMKWIDLAGCAQPISTATSVVGACQRITDTQCWSYLILVGLVRQGLSPDKDTWPITKRELHTCRRVLEYRLRSVVVISRTVLRPPTLVPLVGRTAIATDSHCSHRLPFIGNGVFPEDVLQRTEFQKTQFESSLVVVVARLLASMFAPGIFACGNRTGRYRWSAGFLGDLPFPPPLHSSTAPYSPHLIGSQELSNRPNISTPLRSNGPGMKGRGETGDPRENPPTNGIVRHDSHLRKSGDAAGQRASYLIEPGSIFACGNHAGRCHWSAGFLGNLPFPLPLHSGDASLSPHFTLIGSQDLGVKSRPNLSTPP